MLTTRSKYYVYALFICALGVGYYFWESLNPFSRASRGDASAPLPFTSRQDGVRQNKGAETRVPLMGEGNIDFYQTGSSENHLDENSLLRPSFSTSQMQEMGKLVAEQQQQSPPSLGVPEIVPTRPRDMFQTKVTPADFNSLLSETTFTSLESESSKISSSYSLNAYEGPPSPSSSSDDGDAGSSTSSTRMSTITPTTASPEEQRPTAAESICYDDLLHAQTPICRPRCGSGSRSFALPGMDDCVPLLQCAEIEADVHVTNLIGEGTVKQVFLGRWKNYSVAVNKLRDQKFADDFAQSIALLSALSGHPRIVQLVGLCPSANVYLTEYHQLGNILSFVKTLTQHSRLQTHNTMQNRMRMCVDYASIATFLHNSPVGTRVMCDSGALGKVLEQLLINDGWRLVLNDVDALPRVDKSANLKIVCGNKELRGEFVAPEQRWRRTDQPFAASEQLPYDEKTDVWKLPDVCEYFLGSDHTSDGVKYALFEIHKRCKATDPASRPTAEEVLSIYTAVLDMLVKENG